MKRFISVIVATNYLRLLSRLVLVAQHLGLVGASDLSIIGGMETKIIFDAGCIGISKLLGGLIVNSLNRPRVNEYQRGGGYRRLAVLPT